MILSLLTAVALTASPVNLEFDGTLKDGLKQLAQKSGLNLVVIGDLDERVNLNLPAVDGEAALETIAEAYGLEVTRSKKAADGKLWVVRRASGGAAKVEPANPVPATPGPVAVPPVPPVMPVAPQSAIDPEEAVEQAREEAERIREAAEEAREKARQAADEAREQAREAADQAREEAREAAEQAREQARAQVEVARAKAELARHRVSTGGPVTVEANSRVETAVAYGGPVIINEGAVVEGDAVAFGGDVVLNKGAIVEGDAVSFGGNVIKNEGAIVQGETVSMGGSGIGSAVARNVVKTQKAVKAHDDADEESSGFGRGLAGFLLQFAVFFGLGFVLMLFAPQRMKALEATIRAEPGKNGLAGFLGLIAAVPLTAMLVVTLVGIPVALLMWLALALAVPVGLAVIANALGTKIPTGRLRKTQALALAVGLFTLLLASRIPVLGPMALAVAVFISMGAIIRTRFGQNPRGTPMLDPSVSVPA